MQREKFEKYRRRLNVCAYLVEEKTGLKVSRMHLYYTGDESGSPEVTFSYEGTDVQATIESFDDIVHKILRKDFEKCTNDQKVCQDCDFRYHCGKVKLKQLK